MSTRCAPCLQDVSYAGYASTSEQAPVASYTAPCWSPFSSLANCCMQMTVPVAYSGWIDLPQPLACMSNASAGMLACMSGFWEAATFPTVTAARSPRRNITEKSNRTCLRRCVMANQPNAALS